MKTIKTENALAVYNLVKGASLKGMDNIGKYAVIKVTKALKGVATDFESFREDAQNRLKPENFDAMQEKAMQWQKEGDECKLTDAEKIEINKFFGDYNNSVTACLLEEAQKDNELDIKGLSEAQFEAFIGANDAWTVEQIMIIEESIVGE